MEDNRLKQELIKNRINNSARASVAGLIATFITTLMPFVLRTLMMTYMGEDYVGCNNVILSVVGILNMAELGIGTVMVYFLYEPVSKGNYIKVNAYLMEIRKLYRMVALVILLFGVLFFPLLPQFVSGHIPTREIYMAYICYLLSIAVQYIIYPETTSLLAAFQRLDIQYMIAIIMHILTYSAQVFAICYFHSLFFYTVVVIIQFFITGVLQRIVCKKKYTQYHPNGKLDECERRDIKKRIVSMIGHQMDEKLLSSVDNVYISYFLGLGVVATYCNYVYVVTAITMFINTIFSSVLSSIGNAMIVETRESNITRFNCMFFIGSILAGWSTTCMLCMYQNFMALWMPKHMLSMDIVAMLCVYSYIIQMRRTVQTFKNAAGMWYNDRIKPYVSMGVDLILDYILIMKFGVIGAVISTIICVVIIEMPWETHILFRDYFHQEEKIYVKRFLIYSLASAAICVLTYCLIEQYFAVTGILGLIGRGIICSVLAMLLYFALYSRTTEFKIWKDTFKSLM